VSTVLIISFI